MLSPRNIQAFRTVFNVTHALFYLLDEQGWRTVLTSLSTLDEVLCCPATTTLQKASTAGPYQKNSDLSVLETATAQLFAATAHASAETMHTILSILLSLSKSTDVFVRVRSYHSPCFRPTSACTLPVTHPKLCTCMC